MSITNTAGKKLTPEQLAKLLTCARKDPDRDFASLYDACYPQVFYTAYGLLSNEQDASDAAQQTFLKLFKHLDNISDPLTLPKWLNTTTLNTAKDMLRQRKRLERDTQSIDGYEEGVPVPSSQSEQVATQPDIAFERGDHAQTILAVIDDLPTNLREVVHLYYWQELSTKEIAQTLNIAQGSVKMRLVRARAHLRQSMEAYEQKSETRFYTATLGITQLLQAQAETVTPVTPPWVTPVSGMMATPDDISSSMKTTPVKSIGQYALVAATTVTVLAAGYALFVSLSDSAEQPVTSSFRTEASQGIESKDDVGDEVSEVVREIRDIPPDAPDDTNSPILNGSLNSTYWWYQNAQSENPDSNNQEDTPPLNPPDEIPLPPSPPPASPSVPEPLPSETEQQDALALVRLLGPEAATILINWANGRASLDIAQLQTLLAIHNFIQLQSGATTLYAYQRFTTGIYLSTRGGELRFTAHTGQVQPTIQEILARLW